MNNLSLQLLSYDLPTEQTERFYFLEMLTLQATTLLSDDLEIRASEIVAYNESNEFLEKKFKTIGDFNDFFLNNPDYFLQNCAIELENGLTVGSHDDGEVTITFTNKILGNLLIAMIFEKFQLDFSLLKLIKGKPGQYITIDEYGGVTGFYDSFDDYLSNGRGV